MRGHFFLENEKISCYSTDTAYLRRRILKCVYFSIPPEWPYSSDNLCNVNCKNRLFLGGPKMRKTNLNIPAAVCVFMMALTGPANAITHYVSPGESIQAAIDASSNGDEIEVAPGTYYEAINFNGKAVRLYSSGGPDVTIIDASLSQPLLDNFDDGDYDGWEIIDQGDIDINSVWSAESGQMVQSSNYANPPLTDPNMLGTYAWW
jgi:hypothetical protein